MTFSHFSVLLQVFSIIVFGCIADKGRDALNVCFYNGDSNACNYGLAVGIISFLACMAFLVIDVLFDSLSNVQMRKCAVLADLAFSGKRKVYIFSIMWYFLNVIKIFLFDFCTCFVFLLVCLFLEEEVNTCM